MAIEDVKLDDKYELDNGRIYLTGTQALVRLLLVQQRRDKAAGLNTAGFISGYRGSPMTNMDGELWRAQKHLDTHNVKFKPGINEDLAATMVWGTQQVEFWGDNTVDGVYSLWYSKGPGVDRSLDAIRQGHWHGSTKHGGVLLLSGDDPNMTSTISNWHSELLFEDLLMPVLYPSDIQEVFDLGLYGLAMSRFSGNWVGYKCIPETIETGASIDASHDRLNIVYPEFDFPEDGVNARHPDSVYLQEARIRQYRLPAAVAFARANNLNYISHKAEKPRFGIVAMGKQWRDTLQALHDLGLDEAKMAGLGITILKVRMPFPVDAETYREFSEGLDEVLVIEDKREQIESAIRNVCYTMPEGQRPRVVGRIDDEGNPLVNPIGRLTADAIAPVIAKRIAYLHSDERVQARLGFLQKQMTTFSHLPAAQMMRLPYFCSGCPHNSSTKVPKGSISLGGVGCHFMATWMDRDTHTFCQMGGEGVTWAGISPYVERNHVFQNLGDGTYYHSGLLAIRASIAAGTNITYKLLFNDAVAMTGGQPVDGPISPQMISNQVSAEGVERIVVVVDEKEEMSREGFAPDVKIYGREHLNTVQEELSKVKGVSLLIYVQTCASEKRRRRKRGKFPDPAKRLFINHRVCEGCGDCGVQSNCVSIQPLETEYGRKRKVDQSTCNKDYSCNNGFCPSFVTVLGGQVKKSKGVGSVPAGLTNLPEPTIPEIPAGDTFGMMITGVGGTGVATIGALLSMAGHIDKKGASLVDQLGFAQKGGSVMSHLRLANTPNDINTPRINLGMGDLILACDTLTTNLPDALLAMSPEKTRVVVNTVEVYTGDFTRNPDLSYPADNLNTRIDAIVGKENVEYIDASRLATALLGDSLGSNLFVVGYAWQKGLIPLTKEAILRAIELNNVAVDWNKEAFMWGRCAAHDMAEVERIVDAATAMPVEIIDNSVDTLINQFALELTEYQDAAYADRFRKLVEQVRDVEAKNVPGQNELVRAVARNGYKLMAYKDEYEVARLYSSPAFKKSLEAQFEGDYKLEFNLAPSLLARKDKQTGIPRKIRFGAWMMPVFGGLAKMKGLRGGIFDLFSYTAERRMERAMIVEYESMVAELLQGLRAENHALAVEIANLPQMVRGYGHVKERHLEEVQADKDKLLKQWRALEDNQETVLSEQFWKSLLN